MRNLVLPAGAGAGEDFRLMVVMTSWVLRRAIMATQAAEERLLPLGHGPLTRATLRVTCWLKNLAQQRQRAGAGAALAEAEAAKA